MNRNINKEFLNQKYAKERLSCKQIAELAGVSVMTVHRALVRYGISRRGFDEGRHLRRQKKYGADRQDVYDPKLDEIMQKLMDDLEFRL